MGLVWKGRSSILGVYSQKNWVGVWGPLPKTRNLFMTKICNFPYPINDLTKSLIPFLWSGMAVSVYSVNFSSQTTGARPVTGARDKPLRHIHSCCKHQFVKGFCCWLYLACIAGIKQSIVLLLAQRTFKCYHSSVLTSLFIALNLSAGSILSLRASYLGLMGLKCFWIVESVLI